MAPVTIDVGRARLGVTKADKRLGEGGSSESMHRPPRLCGHRWKVAERESGEGWQGAGAWKEQGQHASALALFMSKVGRVRLGATQADK